MHLRHIALFMSLALTPSAASASLIRYDFIGSNGLSGTFWLDDAVAFDITTTPGISEFGELKSPTNVITGVYDGVAFSGVVTLHVSNYIASTTVDDFWIVRAQISPVQTPGSGSLSPSLGERTVTKLNLFIYLRTSKQVEISIVPPKLFDL